MVINCRYILLCESAVNEILDTLKKSLRESDQQALKSTDTEYYECMSKVSDSSKSRLVTTTAATTALASSSGVSQQRCQECLACAYFNFLTHYMQRNNDALVQCTRFTFDSVKKRMQQSQKYMGGEVVRERVKHPLFRADVVLAIPNVSARPTLDDMQGQMNKAVQAMLRISQDLPEWRHNFRLREIQIRVRLCL